MRLTSGAVGPIIRPMIVITRNPKIALLGLALSAAIFLVLYLTVIKPSNDTANSAIRSSEKQAQQVVNSVDKQTGGAVPSRVKKLTACLAAAGADTGKIQSCQAQYGG